MDGGWGDATRGRLVGQEMMARPPSLVSYDHHARTLIKLLDAASPSMSVPAAALPAHDRSAEKDAAAAAEADEVEPVPFDQRELRMSLPFLYPIVGFYRCVLHPAACRALQGLILLRSLSSLPGS